jgi:hypothetical protein
VNAITDTVPAFGLQPMEFVGETAKLFPAFVKAQKAMGDLLKTSTNPHFKSKYADLAAVVEAVLPGLHANGFGLMQPPHSDGDIVEVETILVHESGGYIRSVLAMRPSKNDPQGVGSAVTYARRYALQSIAGIAPEDDDGNAASGPRTAAKTTGATAPSPPTLAERADRLEATLTKVEVALDAEKAWKLADGLRKELDAKDPERLAQLEDIYAGVLNRLNIRSAA